MNQAELTKKQIVTCSYILCVAAFLSFGKQVGSNGMAYLGAALMSVSLFLFFCYFGVADMIGRMIRGKKSKGFFKDAIHVRKRVLLFQAFIGFLLMAVCFFMAPFLCKQVFCMPYGVIPLRILSVLVFLYSLEAMFGGYFQSVGSYLPEAVGSILRVVFIFLFGKLFAGKLLAQGDKVSALLMNDDFNGMYGAIGLSIGFVIGEALVVVFYLMLYLISDKRGEKKRAAGGHQKVEALSDTCRYFFTSVFMLFLTNLLTNIPMLAMFYFPGRKVADIYALAYPVGEVFGKFLPVTLLFVFVFMFRFQILGARMGAYLRKQDYRSVSDYIGAGMHHVWCLGLYFCVMLMGMADIFAKAFFANDTKLQDVTSVMGLLVFSFLLFVFVTGTLSYLKERFLLAGAGGILTVVCILYYSVFSKEAQAMSRVMVNGFIVSAFVVGVLGCGLIIWKYQVRMDYIRVFVIPLFSIAVSGLVCIFLSKALTPHLGNAISFIICAACGFVIYVALLSLTRSVRDMEISCLYGNLGKRILGLIFR